MAFELLKKATGASYSDANVKIGYFTFDNFPIIYKEFCENDFASWLEEDYTNPSFYQSDNCSFRAAARTTQDRLNCVSEEAMTNGFYGNRLC